MLGPRKDYITIKGYCTFDVSGKYVYQRSTIVDLWDVILKRIQTKKVAEKDVTVLDEEITKKEDFNRFHAWLTNYINANPEEIGKFIEDMQIDRRNNGDYSYLLTINYSGAKLYENFQNYLKSQVQEAIKHGIKENIDGENTDTGPSL